MAGRPSKKKPSEIGARLARLRKDAGLSQAKLAEALGIPQRTLSYYEREAEHLPSTMVVETAKALGVSVEVLLGVAAGGSKRGPRSKLEQQLEAVKNLPRGEQVFVSRFLDTVIAKAHS